MKKGLLCRSVLVIVAMAFVICVGGQALFTYQAELGNVQQAGFYKIVLDPSVVAKCKDDISDIRILDDNNRQVPYILHADQPSFKESRFTELPIISKKKEKDKQTHLVIRNKEGKPVSELLLVIRNTAASRTVTVSGSDDAVNWFVIQEDIALDHFFNPDNDSYIQSLGFPISSYNYFKIIINGKDQLPVNIIRAGVYRELVYNGSFSKLPAPAVTQTDSADRSSYISLLFNDNYKIDKLELDCTGPRYYKRLLTIRQGNDKRFDAATYTIRSDAPASFAINTKSDRLLLNIQNEDNPPLRLSAVKAWQLNRYLLTYLEPAKKYHLVLGNLKAQAPSYDLAFFKNSITNATVLKAGPISKPDHANSVNALNTASHNTILLWTVIIAVLVLLLLLTFSMTKQVDTKEKP